MREFLVSYYFVDDRGITGFGSCNLSSTSFRPEVIETWIEAITKASKMSKITIISVNEYEKNE